MGFTQNSTFGFGSNGDITGGTVTGANNGLSLVGGTTVVFGQNVGEVGAPATLLSSRQLPMGSFAIQFTGADADHYLNINDVGGDGMMVIGGNLFITGTPNSNEIPALRITQIYDDNDAPFVYAQQINALASVGSGATIWGIQATVANAQAGAGITTGADFTVTNTLATGVVTAGTFGAQNAGSGETRGLLGSAVIVDAGSTANAIGIYGSATTDGTGLALGGYFLQAILMEDLGTANRIFIDAAGLTTVNPGIEMINANASALFGITIRDTASATYENFLGVMNATWFRMTTQLGAGLYIHQGDQKTVVSPDGSDIDNPQAVLDVRGDVVLRRFVRPGGSNVAVSPTLDNFKVFTNDGAVGAITYTLPSAEAGLNYSFYVHTNQNVIIDAGAGDTIRIDTLVTAAGGTVTSNTVGSTVTLVCINDTEWVAIASLGTWA